MERKTEKTLVLFFINLVLIILIFIGTIYVGVFVNHKLGIDHELESRGRAIVNSFILARHWNAKYGGVYVEKTAGIDSNPYLKNPDMQGIDGKIYTKKNPSLMIREISEIAKEKKDGFEFNITSLRPINKNNIPDGFEIKALKMFELGEIEIFKKEHSEGSTYFRYMAPLIIEESCLTCHWDQGYKTGEVRGGISVRFNIDQEEKDLAKKMYLILGLAVITLLSLFGIIYRLVHQFGRRLEKTEARLQQMAVTDELTGLKNRRYLVERLRSEVKQAHRDLKPVSCILFDLDHFKSINDRFGHEVGDQVLRTVADTAKDQCRETDILSRFGGEEFVMILPNTNLEGAMEVAERLRLAIMAQKIILSDGRVLTFTASFGVAWMLPPGLVAGEDEASLLKRADDGLYLAKGNGRNRVEAVA
ncbi:MAG: diguanylate cyclase [Desulfuromonadales bacterium]|nr:diguanylate cyclase [Desulfuromonadales bacterium]